MQKLQSTIVFLAIVACGMSLQSCSEGIDISDQELVKRMSECLSEDNKTPGMAVSCGNYQKECQRRGKASGNYIC